MTDVKEMKFNLCNYYGRIVAKEQDGKFFWGLNNYDRMRWKEIPEELYRALCAHYNQEGRYKEEDE